jgi:hypothetical protein
MTDQTATEAGRSEPQSPVRRAPELARCVAEVTRAVEAVNGAMELLEGAIDGLNRAANARAKAPWLDRWAVLNDLGGDLYSLPDRIQYAIEALEAGR